jgi:hypothetical protein
LLARFAASLLLSLRRLLPKKPLASPSPESRLWIDGTSNLHGSTCKADKLDAAIERDKAAAAEFAVAAP